MIVSMQRRALQDFCLGTLLGSYVRGMSLVARAHNVQLKLT